MKKIKTSIAPQSGFEPLTSTTKDIGWCSANWTIRKNKRGGDINILMAKASALSSAVRHLCGVTPTSLSNGGGSVIYSAWRNRNVPRAASPLMLIKHPPITKRQHVLAADLCARCSMCSELGNFGRCIDHRGLWGANVSPWWSLRQFLGVGGSLTLIGHSSQRGLSKVFFELLNIGV